MNILSASLSLVEPVALFTGAALRMPHLLLQLRRFTRQTTQNAVLCVTQRHQCAWQLWIICVQATLALDVSCEIRRNGVKVRRKQGVFVCTVYRVVGQQAVFRTETVPWGRRRACWIPTNYGVRRWMSFWRQVLWASLVHSQVWRKQSLRCVLQGCWKPWRL